jgi:hypothetical protein
MKLLKYFSLLLIPVLMFLTLGGSSYIFAQDSSTASQNVQTPIQTHNNSSNNPGTNKSQEGKQKACLARENAIKTRSEHLDQLAQNMETKFSNIEQRVVEYYTNKVLPKGISVSNYNTLITDINTSESKVNSDISNASSALNSFSCTQSHPRSLVLTYNSDMQQTIQDLRNYRRAIRNLIVAIATSEANSHSNSKASNALNK